MINLVSVLRHLQKEKQYFNINSGVVVTNVRKGGFDQNGIPIGTIIAYINGKPINSSKDIDLAFCLLKEELYKSLRLHLMDPR
jgi:S1-C subfamily serine protease